MLALHHLPVIALLTSCSVYSESLLDESREPQGKAGSLSASEPDGEGTSGGTSAGSGGKGVVATPDRGGTAGKANGGTGSNTAGDGPAMGGGGATSGGNDPPAGGAAGGTPPVLPNGVDLLDDMEDGNFYLSPKPPRFGFWYVASDKTVGSSVPKIEELVASVQPARDGSTSAVHFAASGFKGWGSSVGLSFTDAANQRKPYDAGDAMGIAFWVRGSVAGDIKLRVLFPSVGTDTTGKLCGGAGQGQCLDHFATQITVTSVWTRVPIAFSALHQAGWGALLEGGFDPKTMLGIEWTADQADLDIWIDDLALLRPE